MVSIPRAGENWSVSERYEIRREVGHGSYGHVCEALDTQSGELVAIKRFERIFRDTIDSKRILREIAILPHLQSQYVAQLKEVLPVADPKKFDEIYAVLELAESDLKKVVRSHLVLKQEHVKVIMYRALCGLQYIHSAGVIHRDLKPGNILINSDCSIKLCDFGLAREGVVPSANDTDELLTSSETQKLTKHIATRWYRAPEVVLLNEYSTPVDVWSMGCVFGELLSKLPGSTHKGALFPGKTCYPMSPYCRLNHDGLSPDILESEDQLNVIFSVIGTPSEPDLSFLQDTNTAMYVRNFGKRREVDFREWYQSATEEAIDLLKGMLEFNPEKRVTVQAALAHPYFASVRCGRTEEVSPQLVSLSFDSQRELRVDELRHLFLREIERYHPSPRPQNQDNNEVRDVEELLRRAPASGKLLARGRGPQF